VDRITAENGADVVYEVVGNDVASRTPVAPGIDGTCIARGRQNVADFIELYEVVVALEHDRRMAGVVNQVVSDGVPDTVELYCGVVGSRKSGIVGDLAVLDHMAARHQGCAGSAAQNDPVLARIQHIILRQTVVGATVYGHSAGPSVSQHQLLQGIVAAVLDSNQACSGGFKLQSLQGDVAGTIE
jgi:hypothetical protein